MDARCWPGSNTVLGIAKPCVPGGKGGSPRTAGGGKPLKNLPTPGVDDESLIPRQAPAYVGEIDSRPAQQRRRQHIPLRLKISLDLTWKRGAPKRRPLSRCGRTKAKLMSAPNAEPAKQRLTALSNVLLMLVAPGLPEAILRVRMGRGYGVNATELVTSAEMLVS
jgi:hypothetical protein